MDDADGAAARVAEAFRTEGEADLADGLTVTGPRWWFNLRPSNTEPVLRLNVEADEAHTMAKVRDRVLDLIAGD